MALANSSAFSAVSEVKIQARDWQRLPAWYKSEFDGIPRVLSHANGKAEFIPVQILH